MDQVAALRTIVERIDAILDAYSPPELVPDRLVGEVLAYHEAHAGDLEQAAALATQALEAYPLHPALLLRRAEARSLTRAGDLSAHAEAAEADLRLALEFDNSTYDTAGRLLHLLFTFSLVADADIADAAGDLAERATRDLLALVGLRIGALGYADRFGEARELYEQWSGRFSASGLLDRAFADAAELRGDQDA